jgi:arylsulfatase A-like enzyme
LGCGAPARPDVLLVSVDTLRADRLGYAGHAAARTPSLDRLAREGAAFTQAWTTIPRTTQALASLLTSLPPAQHGVRRIGERLPASARSLAEILREAGFATAAVSANAVAGPAQGLDQGFDAFTDAPALAARYGLRRRGLPGREPEVGPAEAATREALRLLGELDAPRLLWVHYMDPHFVYAPPAPYNAAVDWSRFDFYRERRRHRPVQASTFFDLHGLSSAALPELAALYDAEIAYTDHWLGRLLGGLERETLVVVTADHGESLGENGYYFEHGDFVSEAELAIPLLFWWPGQIPAGLRLAAPVSCLDVAPTLLGLLGLEPPAGLALAGADRSPWLRGAAPAPELGDDLFAESGEALLEDNPRREPGSEPWAALRRGPWKLVRVPGPDGARYALYDLGRDPGEKHDRAAEEPDRVASMRARLDAWWQRARPAAQAPRAAPEVEAELRALGYVE